MASETRSAPGSRFPETRGAANDRRRERRWAWSTSTGVDQPASRAPGRRLGSQRWSSSNLRRSVSQRVNLTREAKGLRGASDVPGDLATAALMA